MGKKDKKDKNEKKEKKEKKDKKEKKEKEADGEEKEGKSKKLKDSSKVGEDGNKKRKLKAVSEKFGAAWQASAKDAEAGDGTPPPVLPERKRLRKLKSAASTESADG